MMMMMMMPMPYIFWFGKVRKKMRVTSNDKFD